MNRYAFLSHWICSPGLAEHADWLLESISYHLQAQWLNKFGERAPKQIIVLKGNFCSSWTEMNRFAVQSHGICSPGLDEHADWLLESISYYLRAQWLNEIGERARE